MTLTALLLFVAFLMASLAMGVTSVALHPKMVDDVNSRLDEKEHFDHRGWHPAKRIRLQREYRRLFPGGPLIRRLHQAAGASLALILAVAAVMKFPAVLLVFLAVGGTVLIVFSSRL
jgi:hypothetical protein